MEFLPDGSVVEAGFKIVIQPKSLFKFIKLIESRILDCECSAQNFKIPCNGSYTLLPITAADKYTYCSKMNCSWNVRHCKLELI